MKSTDGLHRLKLLVLTVLALSSLVGYRLYDLQVQRHEELSVRAERQRQRRIEVHPTRGSILDRQGRILALSVDTQALYAHPWKVTDPESAADVLARVVGLSRREILEQLRSDRSFVYLSRFLEPEQVQALRDAELPIGPDQPFGLLPSSKRLYPRGRLAVHVIGFANIDGVGLEGIECTFDEQLRGDPTAYVVVKDLHGGQLSQVTLAAARPPRDVALTIDMVLQHAVERELDQAMLDSRASAASAVLMDPQSGEILALANRPAADPNRFGEAQPEARINRAVVYQYEPGSTFKIVPMAAALEHGRLRPDQRFDCENGTFFVGSRRVRDSTPHGLLSASEILQESSNIGMVKIARLIDAGTLREVVLRFGFGSETGIELPGEQDGAVRPLAAWNEHSQASLAFGQEIGVTVLQMATAFATVANGGVQVPPRIVLGTLDAAGRLARTEPPGGRFVISGRTARELTAMLEAAVRSGTGKRAGLEGYRLAGKSGTAQKVVAGHYSEKDYIASFGGFGPVPLPRLVGFVVLDTPRGGEYHGGEVAAPVFRRIMEEALSYLRVPADRETPSLAQAGPRAGGRPGATGRRDRSGEHPPVPSTSQAPDVIGLSLREAVSRLAEWGCQAEVDGRGVVVAQDLCRLSLAERPAEHSAVLAASASRSVRRVVR